jgi:serine protease Do
MKKLFTILLGFIFAASLVGPGMAQEKAKKEEPAQGAVVRPLTAQETEVFGFQPNQGVAISRLDFKGPLQEAGFEVGDIILAFNDQPIQGVETFASLVNLLKPHQKITLAALDHKSGQTGMVQVITR